MIVRTALVGAAAAAAFAGGALVAPALAPHSADGSVVVAAARPIAVTDGADAAAEALGSAQFAFRALHPPEPPPAPLDMEPAPIEPDIAEAFRADVTAVLVEKGRRVVVIMDPSAPKGRRTLRVGATYRDGWKVRAIDDGAIELRRRGDVRRIDLFAPPPSPADAGDGATFALSGDTGPVRQRLTRDGAMTTTQKE